MHRRDTFGKNWIQLINWTNSAHVGHLNDPKVKACWNVKTCDWLTGWKELSRRCPKNSKCAQWLHHTKGQVYSSMFALRFQTNNYKGIGRVYIVMTLGQSLSTVGTPVQWLLHQITVHRFTHWHKNIHVYTQWQSKQLQYGNCAHRFVVKLFFLCHEKCYLKQFVAQDSNYYSICVLWHVGYRCFDQTMTTVCVWSLYNCQSCVMHTVRVCVFTSTIVVLYLWFWGLAS